VSVRLVADVAHALHASGFDSLRELAGDRVDRRLVRDLAHHDARSALRRLLDVGDRAQPDRAAAGAVRLLDPVVPEDETARREVGALDRPHQIGGGGVGLGDELERGRRDLTEVVRRDVRRHADGDALGAVHEQVREPAREHERLACGAVVVRLEVDGSLVDPGEHLRRDVGEPALRVPRRSRRIGGRAEVAVLVDEGVGEREVLAEANERVVDGDVAVRVVAPHHVAHDARALHVGAVGPVTRLLHRPEDAAVHGLQAVAHVGERAAHDDAHRVLEERRLDLLGERADLRLARVEAELARAGPAPTPAA
jgi:hypothetical protein